MFTQYYQMTIVKETMNLNMHSKRVAILFFVVVFFIIKFYLIQYLWCMPRSSLAFHYEIFIFSIPSFYWKYNLISSTDKLRERLERGFRTSARLLLALQTSTFLKIIALLENTFKGFLRGLFPLCLMCNSFTRQRPDLFNLIFTHTDENTWYGMCEHKFRKVK